jgi:hypothetical protein
MSFKRTFGIGYVLAAGLALASANGLAQSNDAAQDASPPSLKSLKLTCKDFKHNSDGSWVAVHRLTVGDATVQPGVPLGMGTVVGKVRLAGILDTECLSH